MNILFIYARIFILSQTIGAVAFAADQINCQLTEAITGQKLRVGNVILKNTPWNLGDQYTKDFDTEYAHVNLELANGKDANHNEEQFQTLTINVTPKDPTWDGFTISAESTIEPMPVQKPDRVQAIAAAYNQKRKISLSFGIQCPVP